MKKLTRRKVLSIFLVLSMIASILFTTGCNTKDDDYQEKDPVRNEFIEGIGGVSETFKGSVSELSYSSAEDAAKAFVTEELSGESKAQIKEVVSNGDLKKSEIKKLGIPSEFLEGSDSVEEYEVTYSLSESSSGLNIEKGITNLSAGDTLNKSVTVKVYVIKYENNWKYYTPLPVTGDTISKSYYDSVFNAEKYKNCTFESTTEIDAVVDLGSEKVEMTIKMTQLVKYQDGKIYLEQISEVSEQNGDKRTTSIYAYMEQTANGVECYIKEGNSTEWFKGDITTIGFSNLDELTPFADQYLDYTYFTKTGYGFALEKENARKYLNAALGDAFNSMGVDFNSDKSTLDMFAEYYVSGGVLSGLRCEAEVNMDMGFGTETAKMNEVVKSTLTCTNYGTTVVDKPFED